jgi:hypothetical protein
MDVIHGGKIDISDCLYRTHDDNSVKPLKIVLQNALQWAL